MAKKKAARKSSTRSSRRRSTSVRRPAGTDSPVVIYIHGIGDQGAEKQLKRQWDLALFGHGMADRTRFAFWADVNHPDTSPRRTRSLTTVDNTALEADALLKANGIRATADRVEFLESVAASIAHDRELDGSSGRGSIGKKILPLPGFLRRPIAEAFIRTFLKDVSAYFFDQEKRKEIKNRLIAQIPKDGPPFVLVSHSLGTVVAFEVLSELQDRPDVLQWITIGSPLGLDEVQDLLIKDRFKLNVPKKVRGWKNFADRLDPVASDPRLADDFSPNGPVHVVDEIVVNKRTREIRRFNPHSSVGYLAHPSVRSPVHRAIGFDSAGRFVVARDVAETLVDSVDRQPVLIEALEPGYWAVGESRADVAKREDKCKQPDQLSERIPWMIEKLKDLIIEINAPEDDKDESELLKTAAITPLRKYVAASLTPYEIEEVAERHADMCVYAVWRSSQKSKVLNRSHVAMKADAARTSYQAKGDRIVWAVLDTGVRGDHPHFHDHESGRHNVLQVLDCTTDSWQPEPIDIGEEQDPDGHGTHVSGIIAGSFHNSDGVTFSGVAPEAELLVYKVLDDDGSGYDSWIIKAIDDIFRRNQERVSGLAVHGVNLSLGGPFDPTVYGCGFSPICKELRDLWRQGVLVCVAAGNEGRVAVDSEGDETFINALSSIGDPANLEDCIAVGSVNADKPNLYGVSHFSSRGPTADGRLKPDVVAPGERITSCNSRFRLDNGGFEDLYRADSGTSMACPHVSGMLAAFLSVRREFIGRPDEVKQLLLDSCNDLRRDQYHQGAGIPNLMKMLSES